MGKINDIIIANIFTKYVGKQSYKYRGVYDATKKI
jgi:hypothetical protein